MPISTNATAAMQTCIDACNACFQACEECYTACLNETDFFGISLKEANETTPTY